MKKIAFLMFVTFMILLFCTSTTSFAGKIYKWTENGKVHYGEHPPSGKASQMQVKGTTPYGAAAAPKSSDNSDAASKFLESVAAERKEKKEADDLSAKNKAITDKNCSISRRQVASLKQGGRQYEVDEKGERTYLDEGAVQSRLNEAQKNVEKWCK